MKFARVNKDICRIQLTKFHDIGVENVTNLYRFAGIYEICGIRQTPSAFCKPAKQTVSFSLVHISWTWVRVNPRSLSISHGLMQHKRRVYTLYITVYMAEAAAERLFLSRRILKCLTNIKFNNIGIDTR